jgi:hypothetical protein
MVSKRTDDGVSVLQQPYDARGGVSGGLVRLRTVPARSRTRDRRPAPRVAHETHISRITHLTTKKKYLDDVRKQHVWS